MPVFAAIPNSATGQLILAAILAAAGFFLLLPRLRGRSVAGGTAALLAAAAVFGAWLHESFGKPAPTFGQGDVCRPGVLAAQAPRRLAMSNRK